MRFPSLLAAALLFLAGCARADSARFLLTFERVGTDRERTALTEASVRVVERRIDALGGKLLRHKVKPRGDRVALTVFPQDPEHLKRLAEGLLAPFRFRVMRELRQGEVPDVTLEIGGSFKETGITETMVDWLEVQPDPLSPAKGRVQISFTPEGREILKRLFREEKGKTIALFLRGKLVSKVVSTGDLKENIRIDDIPSVEIARAFADDVNIGVHVKFTQE